APVIAGSANNSSAVVGIAEAGAGGGLEPVSELASMQAIINANPTDMDAILDAVQAALGGASRATAIAHVWDNFVDNYPATGYYNTPVNVLFIRLGVEYARYLKEVGAPLLDVVAKYNAAGSLGSVNCGLANGTPDRVQRLHDNLLGN